MGAYRYHVLRRIVFKGGMRKEAQFLPTRFRAFFSQDREPAIRVAVQADQL